MALRRTIYELDLDRLQEVLDYDPETGHFAWRIRTGPTCKFGKPAGAVNKLHGYRKIGIDGRSYMASHLAWLHFYGVEPTEGMVVDFINGDRDDTRIANLREATFAEDAQNRKRPVNSTTGLKGAARFYNPGNLARYRSSIRVRGKRIFIGLFHTPEDAYAAYCQKAKELHGEFARLE